MKTGIVKMWDRQKGFGFIVNDEDDDDLFVNIRDLHITLQSKGLHEGQSVKFDIRIDMKGDKAVNVRPR